MFWGEHEEHEEPRGGVAAPENGEQSVQARRDKPSTATENRTPLRGDGEALCRAASAAVLVVLYVL